MIVNKDSNPERELYYLGALVIEILIDSPNKSVDFFDAFQALNNKKKVSMNLFSLTLDWLYLIGVVKSQKGHIVKCF